MISDDWPALAGAKSANSLDKLATIEIKRGIFGKVDGAITDYRYIACSPGFDQDRQLQNVSYFGASDISEDFLAWSVHNNIARAIHIYPSKARDADNRGVGFEKHILEIDITQVPQDILLPYALALLHRVQHYTDGVWWEQRRNPEWNKDINYFIPINSEHPITKEEIVQAQQCLFAIVTGLFAPPFSKTLLQSFYNHILYDQQPILLTYIEDVVPVEKILALFLPLNIEKFIGKSFTTFFPSQRAKAQALKDTWDIFPIPRNEIGECQPLSFSDSNPEMFRIIEALEKNVPLLLTNKPIVAESVNQGSIKVENSLDVASGRKKPQDSTVSDGNLEIHKNKHLDTINKKTPSIIPEKKPLMSGRLFLEVAEEEFEKPHPIIVDAYRFLHSDYQDIETDSRFSYQLKARDADNISTVDLALLTTWLRKLQRYANTEHKDIKWKIDFFCALYVFIIQEQSSFDLIVNNHLSSHQVPLLWFFYKLRRRNEFSKSCDLQTLANEKMDFLKALANQGSSYQPYCREVKQMLRDEFPQQNKYHPKKAIFIE